MDIKGSNTLLDSSPKLRRSKSRDVSSRYLSPPSIESTSSPNKFFPLIGRNKAASPEYNRNPVNPDQRKHKSTEGNSLTRGLWPSSISSRSSTQQSNTLADHLGNERLIDFIEQKAEKSTKNSHFLTKQRSCSEFSRFEKEISKENRPFGSSMRFTGKLKIPGTGKSISLAPSRNSVDQSSLPTRRKSSIFSRTSSSELPSSEDKSFGRPESDCSEMFSGTDLGSPATSSSSFALPPTPPGSRKLGIQVPSRYLQVHDPTGENSPNQGNVGLKSKIKRMNSYSAASSQWALSPARASSPPSSGEMKGKPQSFSSLRPSSPSKSRGFGNFWSLGSELFKSKKSSSSSTSSSSPTGYGTSERDRELKLLNNHLVQWRFVNAKAEATNKTTSKQAESTLLNASASLSQLRTSVAQKRMQFEKEKLELKLNGVLKSQVKPLQAWGDMERHHGLALSKTNECLDAVACRVPLIEGAKVDAQVISQTLWQATNLTNSINTIISNLSLSTQDIVPLLSELAEVVTSEKALLEEGIELLHELSKLELQERSLKCHFIQLKSHQEQEELQQLRNIMCP